MGLRTNSFRIDASARSPFQSFLGGLAAFAFGAVVVSSAYAGDIDSAKQQLSKVKVDLENKSWDSIEQDIKQTEEFLDGVPETDAGPVKKELASLKDKAMTGLKEYKSKEVLETAKRELDRAAEGIAENPARSQESIDKATAALTSDDAKKYADPAELAKLTSRAKSLQTMAMNKIAGQKLEFAAPIVKELDEAIAADPFKNAKTNEDTDQAVQQITRLMSRVRGAIEGLPDSDPRVKAINDKLAGYQKKLETAAGGAMAGQAAEQLAKYWSSQQQYFAGWDQETHGPTWDDYVSKSSNEMGDLLMPKTVEVLTRMHGWFDESMVKTAADQYKDNAAVKATLADAHKTVDAAAAKLHAAFNKVIEGGEKIDTPKDDLVRAKPGYLAQRADVWFNGTPYHDQDMARAQKLSEKWLGAMAKGAADLQATLTKMTADASTAWPAIAGAITAEDGFTPDKLDQYKGKTIHLKGNNRLGWDYSPGSYHFARDVNGMPIAGKFDPKVAAAVEFAKKQTGQDLPDESWDLYAVVEGPGKIQQRTQEEGKVKIDGTDIGTVTAERHEAVPCAVVRIIALHAGPVSVGPSSVAPAGVVAGGGSAAAAGSVAAGSSTFKTLEHLAELALCLGAAGLVVMRSRGAMVGLAGTGAAPAPGSDSIALAGLGLAGLGVVWLLVKLVFGDLLPAAGLTLCGIYIASDWLRGRSMLPPSLANAMKPLGLPLAGATALFGVLHLFLGQHWLF